MPKENIIANLQIAKAKARALALRQSDIANAVGASQSQVSRVLAGEGTGRSSLVANICKYVETADVGVSAEAVKRNEVLVNALRSVWDGTPRHADALAVVIRALVTLRPSSSDSEQTKNRKGKR